MAEWVEFESWFSSKLLEQLELKKLEGGTAFKRAVRPALDIPTTLSFQKRMIDFVRLRFGNPINLEGYTCVVFVANTENASAIYSLCFIEKSTIKYICTSPTFDSKDGEYRHRFIAFGDFQEGYSAIAKDISPLETSILSLVTADRLSIDTRVYPPTAGDAAIIDTRVALQALCIAMVLDSQRTLQSHTNQQYWTCLTDISNTDPCFREISTQIEARNVTGVFVRGAADFSVVQCGEKMIPMTISEAMEPRNINYSTWRELRARELSSNLVLNRVTPGLSLSNQWFCIEDTDIGLYDNKAMHARLRRGDVADKSVKSLREARRTIAPELTESAGAISMDAHVYESIETAQKYLLMSGKSLCLTAEHTGITLASLPRAYANNAHSPPPFTLLITEATHTAKFLFDILYTAHCLHTKIGIIEGDLHANNMTLYQLSLLYKQTVVTNEAKEIKVTFTPRIEKPVVAYVAGPRGESDTFVFPYSGLVGCVIDFSRALFGPQMRPELEEEHGKQFTQLFYRDQVARMLKILHKYAPSFTEKHQAAIKAAFFDDPEMSFRAMSYVDFVAAAGFSAKVLAGYAPADTDKRAFDVAKPCIEFLLGAEKVAREHLVLAMHDLIERKRATKLAIPFAGEVLLEKIFHRYKFSESAALMRGATVCDVYNYNLALTYDGRSYETFPPWARFDEMEKHLGPLKFTKLVKGGIKPFLDTLGTSSRIDAIAEVVRASQEALDAKPLEATSSWIE
ncbi:MAG: hypothetical protein KGL39_18870 [Patescibacteria group bacterium]|nr:hypothetical protein [Patescibacteria group bacterium]